MKPTIIFTLSFLLFVFTNDIALVFSKDLVLDTSHKPLIGLGEGYYILPAIWGPTGGGLYPGKTGNQTVPVTVLKDPSEVVRGEPVKFNTGFRPGLVFIGEPLDIAFSKTPEGVDSSKWVVIKGGDDFPASWVGIGGADDHPGKQIIDGYFSIEKSGDYAYKLIFSPTFSAPPGLSFDIVTLGDKEGTRRLVLVEKADYPFEIVFADATGADGIKSIV